MPAVEKLTYKSPSQTHVASGTLKFPGNWIPNVGPNGGRVVIDSLEPVYNLTDITCATTATEGEDTYRAFESVVVEQVDGVQRYNLQGDALRIFLYDALGADRVHENADLAASANQNLVYSAVLPLSKRFSKRPADFALPAELLKEVRIGCAKTDVTGLGVGTGTVTITAANVYLLAHCHEEMSIELKSVDAVGSTSFPSTSGVTLKIGGRLQNLHIYARGVSGGASATGLTELRVDQILPDNLLRNPDLLLPYLRARGAAMNDAQAADGAAVHNDPAAAGRSIPVLFTTEDTSVFDGPVVDDVIVRVVGGSLASAIAIHRAVLPRSAQIEAAVMARHGLSPEDFRTKTKAKSKRDSDRWDDEEWAFMPLNAPMQRRGLRAQR